MPAYIGYSFEVGKQGKTLLVPLSQKSQRSFVCRTMRRVEKRLQQRVLSAPHKDPNKTYSITTQMNFSLFKVISSLDYGPRRALSSFSWFILIPSLFLVFIIWFILFFTLFFLLSFIFTVFTELNYPLSLSTQIQVSIIHHRLRMLNNGRT